jgi:hypothetical protein
MAPETGSMDQAISRAIRSSLIGLERQCTELQQAIADLVAACSSTRPANVLTPTLRAQAAAASLAASLEVLGRFVANSSVAGTQAARDTAAETPIAEEVISRGIELPQQEVAPEMNAGPANEQVEASAAEDESAATQVHVKEQPATAESAGVQPDLVAASQETTTEILASDNVAHEDSAANPVPEPVAEMSFSTPAPEPAHQAAPVDVSTVETSAFDLRSLSTEEQEMHRRANRVAKVSMQDIQLLNPEAVRLGREQKDICTRLSVEIGKARREYERRFGPILGHGVDYFYHWMVEVLGGGDPETLGAYPCSSTPALRQ